jgi:hypothetical protein
MRRSDADKVRAHRLHRHAGGLRGSGPSRALSPERLVWLESPTNPRLLVYDIKAIADIKYAAGAIVVIDNTFATPYFSSRSRSVRI